MPFALAVLAIIATHVLGQATPWIIFYRASDCLNDQTLGVGCRAIASGVCCSAPNDGTVSNSAQFLWIGGQGPSVFFRAFNDRASTCQYIAHILVDPPYCAAPLVVTGGKRKGNDSGSDLNLAAVARSSSSQYHKTVEPDVTLLRADKDVYWINMTSVAKTKDLNDAFSKGGIKAARKYTLANYDRSAPLRGGYGEHKEDVAA